SAKPASAKPARKRAAKPAEPVVVEPVVVEPVVVEPANVHAAKRAEMRAAIDAAIAAGSTTVFRPYKSDESGRTNKLRVYIRWCGMMCGAIAGDPTDVAALVIGANAAGVKIESVDGWLSHWVRHPACRPGGRANGIPAP